MSTVSMVRLTRGREEITWGAPVSEGIGGRMLSLAGEQFNRSSAGFQQIIASRWDKLAFAQTIHGDALC